MLTAWGMHVSERYTEEEREVRGRSWECWSAEVEDSHGDTGARGEAPIKTTHLFQHQCPSVFISG